MSTGPVAVVGRSLEGDIAVALNQLRESKGVSQEALAGQLGRTQSYVAKLETGRSRVTLVAFLQWITALGVEDDELCGLMKSFRRPLGTGSLWRRSESSDD